MNKATWLKWLRDYEVHKRAGGAYESAVQLQQLADLIEETGDMFPFCSYFQRGRERIPKLYSQDGLFGMSLPDYQVLWLPRDVAQCIFQDLGVYLGYFPTDRDFTMVTSVSKDVE